MGVYKHHHHHLQQKQKRKKMKITCNAFGQRQLSWCAVVISLLCADVATVVPLIPPLLPLLPPFTSDDSSGAVISVDTVGHILYPSGLIAQYQRTTETSCWTIHIQKGKDKMRNGYVKRQKEKRDERKRGKKIIKRLHDEQQQKKMNRKKVKSFKKLWRINKDYAHCIVAQWHSGTQCVYFLFLLFFASSKIGEQWNCKWINKL